jgi:hypothetical protein
MPAKDRRGIAVLGRRPEPLDQLSHFLLAAGRHLHQAHLAEAPEMAA